MTIDIPEGYEALGLALGEAVAQAACGKGSERHAEKGEKFSDQLIMSIPKRLGEGGECFCLGQALKKICESRRLPQDRARAEILGAVNYLAAAWCLLGGRESVFVPGDADAPRTKKELVRRIRDVNPAVYQPEERDAPLFPERTPVECRPPLESEWTPAFYIGVDPQGFHIVERDGLRLHLSADAVRKPEDAGGAPFFYEGEQVEFRLRDGKWKPAGFLCMDGNFAIVVSEEGKKIRIPACDVRPAEKS